MATEKPLPPLFIAAKEGDLEEVERLLALGVDINECTELGNSPLHVACYGGHTDIARLLLEKGADLNRRTEGGMTPLHLACYGCHAGTVRLLLKYRADVNVQVTEPGATPLHVSCARNSLDVVQLLLSVPGIDVNMKNIRNRTPVMYAQDYRILALLKKYTKSCDDFPVHTVTKVVLCGNSGAGKSTLAQIILNWPSLLDPKRAVKTIEDHVRKVKPLTAGILSYYVPRSDGSIMLYDLAGHLEYYSSHSSCLEALSQSTPSTFLTLADVSAEPDDVKTQLNYWSAMIGNVCSKCPQPSEVIVIGTHADKVKDKAKLDSLCSLLCRHADEGVNKTEQHFAGFMGLNVTDYRSADMSRFINKLLETNESVRKRCPAISLSCHVLYALLKEKVSSDKAAIPLSDLLLLLDAIKDHGLSTNISEITSYLTTLADKGLIVFFPDVNPSVSWIVLRPDVLLEQVNGAIFAPASFKEHRHSLVSNTGIIPVSVLQKVFPNYDINMIVQFLLQRELCQPVTDTTDASKTLSDCVFFPCLVSVTRPSDITIPTGSFVWRMYTSSGSEFFTPRCLHALVRRLANQFTLPSEEFKHDPEVHRFSRRCTVWSTGIAWLDELGIRFIVEMDKSLQCLSFTVSAEKHKNNSQYPKQHKCVLDLIKKSSDDFCPSVAKNIKERICKGPSMAEVELPRLRKAISLQSPTLADISGKKEVDLKEWLLAEPQLPLLIGVSMKGSSSSVPTLKDLMSAVAAKIPAKWRKVGIQLDIPVEALDDIQLQVAGRPDRNIDAFELVLGKWKSLHLHEYTWSTIIKALEAPSVDAMDVAAELRTIYFC